MYLTKHKIDYNWRFAELVHPDRLKTLKGHDDHVVIICWCSVCLWQCVKSAA